MADPTKYEPNFDFSNFQAAKPKDPPPGAQIDVELQSIQQSIAALVDGLKDVRRSDGKLKNGIVTSDAVEAALLDRMRPGDTGWTPFLAIVEDGERRVLQIRDWIGGTGTKPTTTGYLGANGLVATVNLAVDLRGAAAVAPPPAILPPENLIAPTITGVPLVGQTLHGDDGSWSNASSFARKWLLNGSTTVAGDVKDYVVKEGDLNGKLSYSVTATGPDGQQRTVVSAQTAAVTTNLIAPVNTSPPVVAGEFRVGGTATATDGGWAGAPSLQFTRQWTLDGVDVPNANGPSYTFVEADAGKVPGFRISGSNGGAPVVVTVPIAAIVAALGAPRLVQGFPISGVSEVGKTVTGPQAIWSEAAAVAPQNLTPPIIVRTGDVFSIAPGGHIDPLDLATTAEITFTDDFTGLALWNGVSGLWATNVWFGQANGYSQNDELQWYIDSSYGPTGGVQPWTVNAGILTIQARLAPDALKPLINNYKYTSGMLNTFPTFSQTYGYFEMKAKLPAGKGLWPAFWLLPVDKAWPPELDVMENLGDVMTKYYATTHSGSSGAHTQETTAITTPDLSADFHTFGMDWQVDKITYYFDGAQVGQHLTPPDLVNRPCYMLLNLAVGGSWPGAPTSDAIFPANYQVDYVRSYKAKGSNTWSGDPLLTNQWLRDGANIPGATGPTYNKAPADEGHAISLRVTGTTDAGTDDAVSNAIAVAASVGGGGGGGTGTWSSTDKSSYWTLSNGGLTASLTSNPPDTEQGVRATVGRAADDVVLRRMTWTLDNVDMQKIGIGIGKNTLPLDSSGYFSADALTYITNGWLLVNFAFDTGHHELVTGDVVVFEMQNGSCVVKVNGVTQITADISEWGSAMIYPFIYGLVADGQNLTVTGTFTDW